jgi:hypothetical protein
MVLCLKARESRSLPGLQNANHSSQNTISLRITMRNLRITCGSRALKCGDRRAALKAAYSCCRQIKRAEQPKDPKTPTSGTQGSPKDRKNTRSAQIPPFCRAECGDGAGWSSPVARQAHNLKAAGSNPAPATKLLQVSTQKRPPSGGRSCFCAPDTQPAQNLTSVALQASIRLNRRESETEAVIAGREIQGRMEQVCKRMKGQNRLGCRLRGRRPDAGYLS